MQADGDLMAAAREAAASAAAAMDGDDVPPAVTTTTTAKDPHRNNNAENKCSFVRYVEPPVLVGGESKGPTTPTPWPALPAPGTRLIIRAADGKDVEATVEAPLNDGRLLASPVYLCGVYITPPVAVGGRTKKPQNFLCCIPTRKADLSLGMCGCMCFQTPGASTSNLLHGKGHILSHHPTYASKIKEFSGRSIANKTDAMDALEGALRAPGGPGRNAFGTGVPFSAQPYFPEVPAGTSSRARTMNRPMSREMMNRRFVISSAMNLSPLSMKDKDGFKYLMANFMPEWVVSVPDTRTLDDVLVEEERRVRKAIVEEISEIPLRQISATLDLWTSRASKPFFAFTARYFHPKKNKLIRRLLGVSLIRGNHDATSIATAVKDMLDKYNLSGKKLLTLSMFASGAADGAKKELNALESMGIPTIVCKGHTLQTCINWAIGLNGTVDRVEKGQQKAGTVKNIYLRSFVRGLASKVVGAFNHSTQEMEKLMQIGDECMAFIHANDTRWSSIYDMMSRIVENYKPLTMYWSKTHYRHALLWEAWQSVRQVVGILHPFSEATKQIQGGEGGHISNTLQILRRLENGINMNTFTIPVLGDDKRSETVKFDELAPMVQTMVLELRAELRTRQVAIPVHKLELLACILDPRFPWRLYDDAVKRRAIEALREEYSMMRRNEASQMPKKIMPKESQASVGDLGGALATFSACDGAARSPCGNRLGLPSVNLLAHSETEHDEEDDEDLDEVEAYLAFCRESSKVSSLPGMAEESRLQRTWLKLVTIFPTLFFLATAYTVAAESTSCESERIFSAAGYLLDPLRATMAAWKVEAFLLLNKNVELIPDVHEVLNALHMSKGRSSSVRESIKRYSTTKSVSATPVLPQKRPAAEERERDTCTATEETSSG